MTYITDFLSSIYPWTTAIHIMAVISWMAGIFYLPRLFVYHVEKTVDVPELDPVYQEMERKLFTVIMQPAMITTWLFGIALVLTPGIVDWSEGWPWVKAVMVIGMTGFHEFLKACMKDFQNGQNKRSGRFFRMANEAPTIAMAVIVIMVVVRPF